MKTWPKEATHRDLLAPAMEIKDQAEADEYLEALVQNHMKHFDWSREYATKVHKNNLGYFAGYYDSETMERVNRLFRTTHPILGSAFAAETES